MNAKTFLAMLARDAHVARRNMWALLTQTMLQPLLFTFVFGRVMTGSGMMPARYKGMLAPMIFFGCVYYPWSALSGFPVIQRLVLLNPLVYASEGLRGTLAPQYPHISIGAVAGALAVFDGILIVGGLKKFYGKAVS